MADSRITNVIPVKDEELPLSFWDELPPIEATVELSNSIKRGPSPLPAPIKQEDPYKAPKKPNDDASYEDDASTDTEMSDEYSDSDYFTYKQPQKYTHRLLFLDSPTKPEQVPDGAKVLTITKNHKEVDGRRVGSFAALHRERRKIQGLHSYYSEDFGCLIYADTYERFFGTKDDYQHFSFMNKIEHGTNRPIMTLQSVLRHPHSVIINGKRTLLDNANKKLIRRDPVTGTLTLPITALENVIYEGKNVQFSTTILVPVKLEKKLMTRRNKMILEEEEVKLEQAETENAASTRNWMTLFNTEFNNPTLTANANTATIQIEQTENKTPTLS